MFNTLRAAFGDSSHAELVAAAKHTLNTPSAPLQEQAAALERLSSESDHDSKNLVLTYATGSDFHVWLQQVAGEAVAQMLEKNVIPTEEASCLTPTAREVAAAVLETSDQEHLRQLAVVFRSIPQDSGVGTASRSSGEA